MCRRDDYPPYADTSDQNNTAPPLYEGPRCSSCGGDHFPDHDPQGAVVFPPCTKTPEDRAHAMLVKQGVFRDLRADQDARFRRWARENFKPGSYISPLWHPVVRRECERINAEAESSWEERTERTNR